VSAVLSVVGAILSLCTVPRCDSGLSRSSKTGSVYALPAYPLVLVGRPCVNGAIIQRKRVAHGPRARAVATRPRCRSNAPITHTCSVFTWVMAAFPRRATQPRESGSFASCAVTRGPALSRNAHGLCEPYGRATRS